MAKKYLKNKLLANDIAKERIAILFKAAKAALAKPDDAGQVFARRYVHVARKLAMKMRTPLDRERTCMVCKRCNAFLVAGTTARTRLQGTGKNAHVVVTCLHCGNVKRYHYHRQPADTGKVIRQ
nr:ribonuclease P [Candidatus Sigynarchaeota archaeon]